MEQDMRSELDKRLKKTTSDFHEEQRRKEAREKLREFAKTMPDIKPKPTSTGLELLNETMEAIWGREIDLGPGSDLKQYMTFYDGSYHNEVTYFMRHNDLEGSFTFECRDRPPGVEMIDRETIEKIRKMTERPAVAKLEIVGNWADQEFNGEKIVIGSHHWRDDYYPYAGVYGSYYLGGKGEILEWVREHDQRFTHTHYGKAQYAILTPLTFFGYPVMSGWRGRDWTGVLKKPFVYRSRKGGLELGKVAALTVIADKVDAVINEKMDGYNSLFAYWSALSDALDELNREYSRLKS